MELGFGSINLARRPLRAPLTGLRMPRMRRVVDGRVAAGHLQYGVSPRWRLGVT